MALGTPIGTGGGAPSDVVRDAVGQARDLRRQIVGRLEAERRLFPKAPRDNRLQGLRGIRTQATQRFGLALDHRGQDLGGGGAEEDGLARGHLGKDEPDRELVGPAVHGLAGRLLRRHVLERAEQHASPGLVQRGRLRRWRGRRVGGVISFARPKSRIFRRPSG